MAGLLLFDLANGTTSLTSDLVTELDDDRADPMLRLYAALVVLSRIERGLSPDPDDEGRPPPKRHGWQRWLKRAAAWIPDPAIVGYPTDGSAAWWELRRASSEMAREKGPRVLSRLDFPPMLECAWR